MLKKYLSVSLTIIILCYLAIPTSIASGELNTEVNESTSYISQSYALNAYKKLSELFSTENGEIYQYPEEYGGEFIENGILYIYLVNADSDTKEKYLEATGNSDYVQYLDGEYSLEYLERFNELAGKLCDEYNISGYGTDRKQNRFVIRIHSPETDKKNEAPEKKYGQLSADETIRSLSVLLNDPAICFEEWDLSELYTNLYGGQSLSSSTIGIGGTYNGNDAILVAGHSYNPNGNVSSSNVAVYNGSGNQIATTAYTNFYYGCLGDFAIAECKTGYLSTNRVYGISSATYRQINGTAYSGSTPVGTIVYKYGMFGGYAIGTISYLNQTVVYKPSTYVQVCGLNFFTISLSQGYDTGAGDSGGPVYISNSGYKLVGTISGGPASNDTAQLVKTIYYSPIYYAEYAGFTVKTS